jgi:tRNA 2-selenouridine synthase
MRHEATVPAERIGDFQDILDVRSPGEFAVDHVPGARNFPVLSDEERARVGTLYKQSPFDARKLGAALISRNIASHLEQSFGGQPRTWRPLVYCWRGGKRSAAMTHVLREVGWNASTLNGGYRAYRQAVLEQLQVLPGALTFRVLCGPTGSAKSRLLEALAAGGAQVLDLESLARHRGSVLGDLPAEPQPEQKMFDSLVLAALRGFDASRPVLVEAESQRIGALRVPEVLLARMRASECVVVEAPLQERVDFLLREYRHFLANPGSLKAQLSRLTELHSRETVSRWMGLIDAGEWPSLVGQLLIRHYDPAYRKSTDRHYPALGRAFVLQAARLDAHGIGAAAAALLQNLPLVAPQLPEGAGAQV